MRCREGDLAVVIKSDWEYNIGRLVKCVKIWQEGIWVIETTCVMKCSVVGSTDKVPKGMPILVYDNYLRPIRDNDGEDETTHWEKRIDHAHS